MLATSHQLDSKKSILLMNATLETTWTHKQILSLKWEGDCDCSQAKIPNFVFWGRKNTGSTFWYRFWAATGSFFYLEKPCLLPYQLQELCLCYFSVPLFINIVHEASHSHHLNYDGMHETVWPLAFTLTILYVIPL